MRTAIKWIASLAVLIGVSSASWMWAYAVNVPRIGFGGTILAIAIFVSFFGLWKWFFSQGADYVIGFSIFFGFVIASCLVNEPRAEVCYAKEYYMYDHMQYFTTLIGSRGAIWITYLIAGITSGVFLGSWLFCYTWNNSKTVGVLYALFIAPLWIGLAYVLVKVPYWIS
jgi:hypothetical protein